MRKVIRSLNRLVKYTTNTQLKKISVENVMDFVEVSSGVFNKEKVTLFSIFKDEIFFCKSFFDHYRSIGVEQFLILDDRSTDGTERFLRDQPDCVVLS